MQPTDDGVLLREYAQNHSDEAFAGLVARHVHLVYSVALRSVGDPHQAEEVAQAVFILLARKAALVRHENALSSWLFQTTRLTAMNFLRSETRRHRREQEAHMQSTLNDPGDELWPRIAPLLDEAVARLNEQDRQAIVLRYYEGRNLRELGTALGTSEGAAEKRVHRALGKLRKFFGQHGVAAGASGLALTLSANAVHAAPAGLAATLATAATAATAAAATAATATGTLTAPSSITATTSTALLMTATQKVLIAVIVAAATAGVFVIGGREPRRDPASHVVTNPAPPAPPTAASTEMTTTASGLKYRVLRQGTGTVSPTPADQVRVHYHGTLVDGTVFDSSMERGKPMTFPVDSVIAGWTEGIQLMRVGDVFKFEIPPHLGYDDAHSRNSNIPPNSTLVFEVELLGIN